MAIQLSVAVRNAGLDSFESTTGTAAVVKIFDGAIPANCAAADAGSVLVSMTLDSDWMAAASSGSKAKAGTWSASASGSGTAQYFRLYASNGITCHLQGTVSTTGADLNLDNTSINSGQTVTISTFTLSAGNA